MHSADDKQEFILSYSPETLHGDIIKTGSSFLAFGRFHVELFRKSCVTLRAVLASPIRMIDETWHRFLFLSHEKGCDDGVSGNS
jgi:hypothetical protein